MEVGPSSMVSLQKMVIWFQKNVLHTKAKLKETSAKIMKNANQLLKLSRATSLVVDMESHLRKR